jgi:hypothetical protein
MYQTAEATKRCWTSNSEAVFGLAAVESVLRLAEHADVDAVAGAAGREMVDGIGERFAPSVGDKGADSVVLDVLDVVVEAGGGEGAGSSNGDAQGIEGVGEGVEVAEGGGTVACVTDVGDIEDEVFAELLLDTDVPLFDPGVVHIHVLGFVREVSEVDLGDVDEAGGDTVFEEEWRVGDFENGGARLGGAGLDDERRLKPSMPSRTVRLVWFVEDAEGRTDNGAGQNGVGDANAGGDVGPVGVNEGAAEDAAVFGINELIGGGIKSWPTGYRVRVWEDRIRSGFLS